MAHIQPDRWEPSAGINLEKAADTVLRSSHNYAVIAGPGAGKTELLAQRAGHLLQTNLCPAPKRILAISFKRDAASNLEERVRLRCGDELTLRFKSMTFDAFAKTLLDRFRDGLSDQLKPPVDYDIALLSDKTFLSAVDDIRNRLTPPAGMEKSGTLRSLAIKDFIGKHLCARPLASLSEPANAIQWGATQIWYQLLSESKCRITFDMVKRLAAFILETNPYVLQALRMTYSHVFLDEFQDTTNVQYDLLTACFKNTDATLTAVGDPKQTIMRWANAVPGIFETYSTDFDARKVQLILNHRSDSELVRIQHHIMGAIDPDAAPTQPSEHNREGTGCCEILVFKTDADEAEHVCDRIFDLIASGVKPAEICILAHMKTDIYARGVISALVDRGIKCRVENDYQDCIKEDLIRAILSMLRIAVDRSSPDCWQLIRDLVFALRGVEDEDTDAGYREERRLSEFVHKLRDDFQHRLRDMNGLVNLVKRIIRFCGGRDAIRAFFPQYSNVRTYSFTLKQFVELFWPIYSAAGSWTEALDAFEGVDTVPAMTIHKSKGLEYHTVFFLGLEDEAWWNFARQTEEDTCAFFVAFSRAKKQVYFTFCEARAVRDNWCRSAQTRVQIASLYDLLKEAGVKEMPV